MILKPRLSLQIFTCAQSRDLLENTHAVNPCLWAMLRPSHRWVSGAVSPCISMAHDFSTRRWRKIGRLPP